MELSIEYFVALRDMIKNALDSAPAQKEEKLDEAAKLLLLNSQYATAYEAFKNKAVSMSDAEVAEFLITFEKEVKEFKELIEEYISTL
jgi:hypothetical protein